MFTYLFLNKLKNLSTTTIIGNDAVNFEKLHSFTHPIKLHCLSNLIVIADFGDFSGDMNPFQLSNVGVTTWFHAGANSANTSADTANNATTSSSSMNQMAAKGFTPRLFSLSLSLHILFIMSLFLCLSFSLCYY